MFSEPLADRQFRARVHSEFLWRIRSDELHQAAELVWFAGLNVFQSDSGERIERATLYRPAQLLMGLSLEALLKGLVIQRIPSIITGSTLPKQLQTHSLLQLFELAELQPPATEEALRFLRQLSDAIEWVSKYPVPTKAAHLERTKHGDSSPLGQFHHTYPVYQAIRDSILNAYPAASA